MNDGMKTAPHGLDTKIGFEHRACFRIPNAVFFSALKGMYDDFGSERTVLVFRIGGN